jgi:hypothetical protein
MGFLGGGSASSSQTLSNIIAYSPVLNSGGDNKNDLTTALDQRASSEATAKDTASASVGVGVAGGSGSGGAVAPTEANSSNKTSVMDGVGLKLPTDMTAYYIGGGVLVGGGVLYAILKKKKRK